MTSVRNHLLPLSGNKLLTAALAMLVFTGIGCKTTKPAYTDSGTKKTETVTAKPTKPADKATTVTDKKDDKKKDELKATQEVNIAILLPLFLNATQADSGKTAVPNPASKMGVDYYKGVQVALDSLKAKGLKAKVHIYDSQNDETIIKQLLAKGELDKADLIIGPVYNSLARLVAEVAKKKGITMISPLSPADNITSNNPNFVIANPPLEVHCEELYKFAAYSFPNANFVMYHLDNAQENKYASIISKMAAAKTGKGAIKLIDEKVKGKGLDANYKTHLSLTAKNVIIVPSMDLPFLVNLSKELNQLAGTYDITVMGLPVWGVDENLRLDYLNTLKVHFTTSYYVQPDFYSKNNPLYKSFVEKFSNEPSENAIKGYDLMNYVGGLMIKHGKDFKNYLSYDADAVLQGKTEFKDIKQEDGNGLHTGFQFRVHKTVDATGKETIDFVENHYVNILRFQDNTLKLMNPR